MLLFQGLLHIDHFTRWLGMFRFRRMRQSDIDPNINRSRTSIAREPRDSVKSECRLVEALMLDGRISEAAVRYSRSISRSAVTNPVAWLQSICVTRSQCCGDLTATTVDSSGVPMDVLVLFQRWVYRPACDAE